MSELGARLKEARQKKGLSLDDLEKVTKIQKRYLRGIEKGDYDIMPGKFYVRAFIKQYAEAVDIPPEQLFEEYRQEIPLAPEEDIPKQISRVQERRQKNKNSPKFLEHLPKILVALVVIAAIWLLWFLKGSNEPTQVSDPDENNKGIQIETDESVSDSDKKEEQKKTKEEKDNKEDDASDKQALEVVDSSGKKTVYELTNTDKFELKVSSVGETWIEIKNNQGKVFFSGILSANGESAGNEVVDFTNEDEAFIVVGNAADTEIFINDEKLEYEISPTDVVRQDIVIQFDKTTE